MEPWKRPTPCNFRVERDTVRHLGSNLDVAKETEANITDKLANVWSSTDAIDDSGKKRCRNGKIHYPDLKMVSKATLYRIHAAPEL